MSQSNYQKHSKELLSLTLIHVNKVSFTCLSWCVSSTIDYSLLILQLKCVWQFLQTTDIDINSQALLKDQNNVLKFGISCQQLHSEVL